MKFLRVPEYLDLAPTGTGGLYVRAAFLSWANLVRRAACDALDVESDELTASFVALPRRPQAEAAIFLSDRLANGAGYCTEIAKENRLRATVIDPLIKEGSGFYERLVEAEHARNCDGSCYDCLRDYQNSGIHAVLDWRLGLDLARLSNDPEAAIDLRQPYWEQVTRRAAASLVASFGECEVVAVDGLLSIQRQGGIEAVITHPLWSLAHPAIKQVSKTLGFTPAQLPTCRVFDAIRRPGWRVSQRLQR